MSAHAEAQYIARPVGILITNGGGNHAAKAWAQAVVNGLVSMGPDIAPARRAAAILVRIELAQMFEEAFEEAKPTSSREEILDLTRTCMSRIEDIFARTPWLESVKYPEIKAQIEQYVANNIASAADLALKTE